MNDLQTLTDSQLIGILIGNNTLSEEILSTFSNDLSDMARNLIAANIKGLGNTKLRLLASAFELGKRKAKKDELK